MRSHVRVLLSLLLAAGLLVALPVASAMAARVELLNGTIRPGDRSHAASGRAAVVQIDGAKRVLTLKNFRIQPGGKVLLYLVPRSVRANDEIEKSRNYRVLGQVRGNKGNAQFTIPRSVDLRRFNNVVFWCVPFTYADPLVMPTSPRTSCAAAVSAAVRSAYPSPRTVGFRRESPEGGRPR